MVDKPERRMAPRASNQFRVGPPFLGTEHHCPLFAGKSRVYPQICARLDRGFEMIDGEWIGYKRNYFTLVAAFGFALLASDAAMAATFHTHNSRVAYFTLKLTAVSPDDSSVSVSLVQHTAKRDKGPQFAPPVYTAVPGTLPDHHLVRSVANIRNTDKISLCHRLFYMADEPRARVVAEHPGCLLSTYPPADVATAARYERIQFQSGSLLKKLHSTKHYVLVVQLWASTQHGEVLVASARTPMLVVRGRSPSNYPAAKKRADVSDDSSDKENDAPKLVVRLRVPKAPLGDTLSASMNLSGKLDKVDPNLGRVDPKLEVDPVLDPKVDPCLLQLPPAPNTTPLAPILKQLDQLTLLPPLLPASQTTSLSELCERAHRIAQRSADVLFISQESIVPPLAGSESSGRHEQLNVLHSDFRSESDKPSRPWTSEFRLFAFDDSTALLPGPLLNAPQSVSENAETALGCARTSTPNPPRMAPLLNRNLFPGVEWCKHGSKKRRRRPRPLRLADLRADYLADSSFREFYEKLTRIKTALLEKEFPLSPLTSHGSREDVELFVLR